MILFLAWLEAWRRILLLSPALPRPVRRWTPTTWEERCLGAAWLRYEHGYLPMEQALRMSYAYRTEYHNDEPASDTVISHGSLVGLYVPATLRWELIVRTPSTEEG